MGKLEAMLIAQIPHCSSVEHAKALAFLKALEFAKEVDITHFELQGDALNVVNRINNSQIQLFFIGHIINEIR